MPKKKLNFTTLQATFEIAKEIKKLAQEQGRTIKAITDRLLKDGLKINKP